MAYIGHVVREIVVEPAVIPVPDPIPVAAPEPAAAPVTTKDDEGEVVPA
jgi:hypothetical protein